MECLAVEILLLIFVSSPLYREKNFMAIFSPLLEGQFCSRELQLLTVPYKQYFSFSCRRILPLPSFSVAKMKTQIVISVGGDSPRRCS
ncbi:hypothetical protein Peur_007193 [Populus x canadensis]